MSNLQEKIALALLRTQKWARGSDVLWPEESVDYFPKKFRALLTNGQWGGKRVKGVSNKN